ncbi:hypothetical protein HK098_001319 [Nowakowskiella sp. JEL0407]|nr:hypothetical protein HK098_001319 [Nowakowskiella sp. JEL0407]
MVLKILGVLRGKNHRDESFLLEISNQNATIKDLRQLLFSHLSVAEAVLYRVIDPTAASTGVIAVETVVPLFNDAEKLSECFTDCNENVLSLVVVERTVVESPKSTAVSPSSSNPQSPQASSRNSSAKSPSPLSLQNSSADSSPKTISHKSSLNIPTTFPCKWDNTCNEIFLTGTELKQHISDAHIGSARLGNLCLECKWPEGHETSKRTFKKRDQIVQHMITHIKDKPHVCETCGSRYKHRQDLKKHRDDRHSNTARPTAPISVYTPKPSRKSISKNTSTVPPKVSQQTLLNAVTLSPVSTSPSSVNLSLWASPSPVSDPALDWKTYYSTLSPQASPDLLFHQTTTQQQIPAFNADFWSQHMSETQIFDNNVSFLSQLPPLQPNLVDYNLNAAISTAPLSTSGIEFLNYSLSPNTSAEDSVLSMLMGVTPSATLAQTLQSDIPEQFILSPNAANYTGGRFYGAAPPPMLPEPTDTEASEEKETTDQSEAKSDKGETLDAARVEGKKEDEPIKAAEKEEEKEPVTIVDKEETVTPTAIAEPPKKNEVTGSKSEKLELSLISDKLADLFANLGIDSNDSPPVYSPRENVVDNETQTNCSIPIDRTSSTSETASMISEEGERQMRGIKDKGDISKSNIRAILQNLSAKWKKLV